MITLLVVTGCGARPREAPSEPEGPAVQERPAAPAEVTPACKTQICRGQHLIRDESDLRSITGCVQIQGDLAIKASTLTTLDRRAFACLEEVNFDLIIMDNEHLTDIEGLRNLTIIGRTLEVRGNGKLVDIEGLRSLKLVGGTIQIGSNPRLESIAGLRSVAILEGCCVWMEDLPSVPRCQFDRFEAKLRALGWIPNEHREFTAPNDGPTGACDEALFRVSGH